MLGVLRLVQASKRQSECSPGVYTLKCTLWLARWLGGCGYLLPRLMTQVQCPDHMVEEENPLRQVVPFPPHMLWHTSHPQQMQ